jgi:hypothetical protein
MDTVPPITGALDPTLTNSQWRFDVNNGVLFGPLNWTASIQTVVPEPSPALLTGLGLALLALGRRSRRR